MIEIYEEETWTPTLYSKDSKGKLREWKAWTDEGFLIMEYGLHDGKKTRKEIPCEPKNIGKANATTASQQAVVEMWAKFTKQKKSGYFETIREAEAYVPKNPMKAKDYKDHKKKVTYPCYMQPKLNGVRMLTEQSGSAWSKSGEPMAYPEHWEHLSAYANACGGLDGEIYAGLNVLSLQAINSARQNNNEDTLKLRYYVYDIPRPGIPFKERVELMKLYVVAAPPEVVFVDSFLVHSEQEADALYQKWVAMGYEGAVYRALDGEYEFEKRSDNLIKRKPRPTAEARIISVVKDRAGQGVMTVEAINGEQVGVQFDLLMLKSSVPGMNARLYEDALTLIGKTIEYAYEELSDERVPTKPVGERLREVDANGESKD